jgi:predicted dehydrogenase
MSGAPLRVAVVGTGFGRNAIAPAFQRSVSCTVVDVVSARDPAEVAAVCARNDVDLVSVHAAPAVHRDLVDRVLDAGHHVVCDKPFGRNLADAEHMAARGRESDRCTLLTFQFRFTPWRQAVRTLLTSGVLGDLESVDWVEHHTANRGRSGGWQMSRASGGGWLGAMGSHVVDTVLWWSGGGTLIAADLDGDPATDRAESTASLQLSLADGGRSTVVIRGAAAAATGPRVLVAGSAGVAEMGADGRHRLIGCDLPEGMPEPPPDPGMAAVVDAWVAAVVAAVEGHPDPTSATFEDGLAWARIWSAARGPG